MSEKNLWPGWETVRLIGRGSFGAVYEIEREVFGHISHWGLERNGGNLSRGSCLHKSFD